MKNSWKGLASCAPAVREKFTLILLKIHNFGPISLEFEIGTPLDPPYADERDASEASIPRVTNNLSYLGFYFDRKSTYYVKNVK